MQLVGFVLKGLDFSKVLTAAGSAHSVGEASDGLAKELEKYLTVEQDVFDFCSFLCISYLLLQFCNQLILKQFTYEVKLAKSLNRPGFILGIFH